LLSEDSYLLKGLQSADETKMRQKAKLQNAPTFTWKKSHSHVGLLLVIKIKSCTYQLCKRQSTDTNVLIGWYQLSAKRLIISRFRLSADYLCIFNSNVNIRTVQLMLTLSSLVFLSTHSFILLNLYFFQSFKNNLCCTKHRGWIKRIQRLRPGRVFTFTVGMSNSYLYLLPFPLGWLIDWLSKA